MSNYNFGDGHLGFQDGRHTKSILLYVSPPWGKMDIKVVAPTFFGSRKRWVDSQTVLRWPF